MDACGGRPSGRGDPPRSCAPLIGGVRHVEVLVGTLSGQGHGSFTVFAPTDEAFAKLPPGTVESLLKDPPALKKILLYHVVAGTVPASQVVGLTSAKTLDGQSVSISVKDGTVYLNETTKVVKADVMARNGVIHVIDAVLITKN